MVIVLVFIFHQEVNTVSQQRVHRQFTRDKEIFYVLPVGHSSLNIVLQLLMLRQLFHKFLRVLKDGYHNIGIVLQAMVPLQQSHEIEGMHVLQAGHLKMAIVWQVRMRLQLLTN